MTRWGEGKSQKVKKRKGLKQESADIGKIRGRRTKVSYAKERERDCFPSEEGGWRWAMGGKKKKLKQTFKKIKSGRNSKELNWNSYSK